MHMQVFQWWSAVLLGLGSGLHCAAMCGPLVLHIPFYKVQNQHQWISFFVYGVSKAMGYALIGLIPGMVGYSIKDMTSPFAISMISGVLLLLILLVPAFKKFNLSASAINKLYPVYQKLLAKPTNVHLIWMGLFNAVLPCSMVYIALAASISVGSPAGAFTYMLLFGISTLPVLLMINSTRSVAGFSWLRSQSTSVIIAFLLAFILIWRGVPSNLIPQLQKMSLCLPPSN
mgnify:CR=1 FL=1